MAHRIAYPLHHSDQQKCNRAQNAGKQNNADDSKIIEGIVKQRDRRQLLLRHIDWKIHQGGNQELQSGQRPQGEQHPKAEGMGW